MGSETERRNAMCAEVARLRSHADQVLVLPEGIGTLDGFVEAVQRIFPVCSPVGTPRERMSWDQVWDMHLDWAGCAGTKTLVVWPEFDGEGWDDRKELGDVLGDYVWMLELIDDWGQADPPWFRMVGSCPDDLTGLHEGVRLHYGRKPDDPPGIEIVRRRLGLERLSE